MWLNDYIYLLLKTPELKRWFWHQDKICLFYFECSMDQTIWNFITNAKVFSKFTHDHCLKPLVINLTFNLLCFLSRVCLMLYTHLTLIGFFPSGSSFLNGCFLKILWFIWRLCDCHDIIFNWMYMFSYLLVSLTIVM
jgi:hypothetical protein